MLNIFYWYSLIWGAVLALYALGWSNYNVSLNFTLLLFLIVSIFITLLLGSLYRNRFRYVKLEVIPKRRRRLTYLTVGLCLFEFIYSKNIPLFFIITGRSSYGEFQGIPLIHSLLENFIIFYSGYLFYLFLESKNKTIFLEVCLILSMLLLMFHKGALIFCLFIIINLAVAKIRQTRKIMTPGRFSILIVVVLIILYLNGGLANLRTGFGWNDNEFIVRIGQINNKWPEFIPQQFSWAYTYITSPLANLNLMVETYAHTFSWGRMLVTVVPVFISKRFFPTLKIDSTSEYVLNISALNACTGFAEPTVAAGITGIWFYFLVFLSVVLFIMATQRKKSAIFRPAFFAILSMQITFLFFYNTLTTAATSWLIIYILFYTFVKRIKIIK